MQEIVAIADDADGSVGVVCGSGMIGKWRAVFAFAESGAPKFGVKVFDG